ncbi:hypothetical protein BEN30_13080 [Magnetovibrio blakemorei]|uniref:histidine kinase n=2 Tax=Magnetovibrio blakemorei TaxID=28181 RepID=A0A1E5Q626_9PROT|nr:hypothetical protein BEN30_13080 [Magnetovibrio blakemorei]
MNGYEQVLQGVVGLFHASENITRKEFNTFVNSLKIKKNWPGIQGIGFSIPVTVGDKAKHIREIRNEGFPEYTIKPEGDRDEYSAIIYLEPFDWRNERAFGYDMWSNDMRREAMTRARDTGEASTSGIITLVQETNTDVQKGFLTYLPLYQDGVSLETIEQRRKAFIGWVYSPFRMGDLMTGILGSEQTEIEYEIFDGERVSKETMLFDSNKSSHEEYPLVAGALMKTVALELQGRKWALHFTTGRNAQGVSESRQPIIVAIVGLVVSFLLFFIVSSLALRQKYTEKIAQNMESELRNATELALANEEKAERSTDNEIISEILSLSILSKSLNDTLEKALKLILSRKRFKHFGMGTVFLFDELTNKLHMAAQSNLAPQIKSMCTEINLGQCLCGQAALLRKTIMKFCLDHDHEITFDGINEHGHICEPIQSGEKLLGVLNLYTPHGHHGTEQELKFVKTVSNTLSGLIKQKRFESELAIALDTANAASEAKSAFLAAMSHELRTPLNAVLGFGQMLQFTPNAPLSPNQNDYVENILESGNHLLKLVNQILDLASIEAYQIDLSLIDLEANEVISNCVNLVAPLGKKRSIEIVDQFSNGPLVHLFTDSTRLKQVLINLLGNAIKFNKDGGTVTIEGTETDYGYLRISVIDTGIGIAAKNQSSVFNLFHRVDADSMIAREGTGIGLTVSRLLAERLGGRIDFESEEGLGSTFWIELPLANNDDVLIWTEVIKIGVDTIDKDHQVLVSMVNRLMRRSADMADVDEIINELIEYRIHAVSFHSRRSNYGGL